MQFPAKLADKTGRGSQARHVAMGCVKKKVAGTISLIFTLPIRVSERFRQFPRLDTKHANLTVIVHPIQGPSRGDFLQ